MLLKQFQVFEGVSAQLLAHGPAEEEDGAHDQADEGRNQE